MSVFETRPERAIAAEHCSTQPRYLGIDATGAAHYWSFVDQHVVVVESENAAVATEVPVDDAVCGFAALDRPLLYWARYTESERGWDDCKITADALLSGGI